MKNKCPFYIVQTAVCLLLSTAFLVAQDIEAEGDDPDVILTTDNGASSIGLVLKDGSGLTANPSILWKPDDELLKIGSTTGQGINLLTTLSSTWKVGINETNNLKSQVTIKANSGNTVTPAQLELRENNNADFSRLRYTNSNEGFWDLAGFCTDENVGAPVFNIFYDKNGPDQVGGGVNIISIDGDDERVGMNTTAPTANLHIKQVGTNEEGLAIENNGGGNDVWSLEIGTNDLTLYYDADGPGAGLPIVHGSFDDSTLGNYVSSDRRLKNSIEGLNENTLDKVMQLKPSKYYYNHNKKGGLKTMGFIAQEVIDLFPEAVAAEGGEEGSDYMMVNYRDFSVIAIKAIQEQQVIIDKLQQEMTDLRSVKSELAELRAAITGQAKTIESRSAEE